MTSKEFSNQFDIQYNSIATNSAPSLDLYEKSVYLTRAQLEIVKNHFDPLSNKKQKGFEGDSKRRQDLKALVKHYNSVNPVVEYVNRLSDYSKFFTIPNDVFAIIQEECVSKDIRLCKNKDLILQIEDPKEIDPIFGTKPPVNITDYVVMEVKPKSHDEYNTQKKNPFKRPNDKIAWRIDYGYAPYNAGLQNVEIISKYDLYAYRLRYVKHPRPIILADLNTLYPGENLSIEGRTGELECELSEGIQEEILDRAVELALADYKPDQQVSLKAQLNTRNE